MLRHRQRTVNVTPARRAGRHVLAEGDGNDERPVAFGLESVTDKVASPAVEITVAVVPAFAREPEASWR